MEIQKCPNCQAIKSNHMIRTTKINNVIVCYLCGKPIDENKSSDHNNGGDTDYYNISSSWKGLQDIIEARNLNYAQANILKVGFTINIGRHNGTDYERELNKCIWFCKRELNRIAIK